jgi:two-component system chemotaxis response regulator CheB
MRVLIVEDSRVVRARLVALLRGDGIELETAEDGEAGVARAVAWQPAVVLMDLRLPKLDGLSAIAAIMRARPCPIIVLSGALDAERRFEALRSGAVEVVDKAQALAPEGATTDLLHLVKLYANARVIRRASGAAPPVHLRRALEVVSATHTPASVPLARPELLVIGASTGGPPVLSELLAMLPAASGVPVLIAQHIEPGFVEALARWLSRSGWPTQIAKAGGRPVPGEVRISPAHASLFLQPDGRFGLKPADPNPAQPSPSVDCLFQSVAACRGVHAAGVLLTGMGDDGARGLFAMRQAGALTFAQDEASCVVFGMPGAAVRLGAAQFVLPPAGIGGALRLRLRLKPRTP